MERIKYNSEIEYEINTTKCYYKIGTDIFHRLDGAAIEFSDGYKAYYIYGKLIEFSGTDEEWLIKNLLE